MQQENFCKMNDAAEDQVKREEEAAEILKNLGPKEVQQLGKEMYNVQGLDQDTVNRVLDEFLIK